MIAPLTSIEPPELGMPPAYEECNVEVSILITETDGTRRLASLELPDPDNRALANALLTCLRAVAVLRGPELVVALMDRDFR